MAQIHIIWFLVAIMGCVMKGSMGSMDHIVGASSGWTIPTNLSFYQEWAQTKNFVVGDKLVFPYTTGVHNLLEVSKADFDACTQKTVIDMFYAGPTVLPLTKPGPHYYYCGVGTHCEAGQKLSINVSATAVPLTADGPTPPEDANSISDKSSANSIQDAVPFGSLILLYVLFSLL